MSDTLKLRVALSDALAEQLWIKGLIEFGKLQAVKKENRKQLLAADDNSLLTIGISA